MKTDGPLVPPAGGEAVTPPGAATHAAAGAAAATPAAETPATTTPATATHFGPGPGDAAAPLSFRAAFAPRDLLGAGVVAVAIAAVGVPVGLLWAALGPRASVLITADGAVSAENRPEVFVGADGSFGALGIAAGFLLGAGVYFWRRGRGPWMAIGLAVGSLAGAYVASKVGHQVGLGTYEKLLAGEPTGQRFQRPVGLRADGMLFLQPLVAVVVYVLAAGWSRFGDLGRVVPDEDARRVVSDGGPRWVVSDDDATRVVSDEGARRVVPDGGVSSA
ncbi:MAG TPA: hypothetical protein VGP02_18005 [Mycobacteriales bacterium]|nr:hypothetical protein [Mycobacteriales bacterium]